MEYTENDNIEEVVEEEFRNLFSHPFPENMSMANSVGQDCETCCSYMKQRLQIQKHH